MKSLKYILGALAVMVALAGCASSSGVSNYDTVMKSYEAVDTERMF